MRKCEGEPCTWPLFAITAWCSYASRAQSYGYAELSARCTIVASLGQFFYFLVIAFPLCFLIEKDCKSLKSNIESFPRSLCYVFL